MSELLKYPCPRCSSATEAEYYGPCGACRSTLRAEVAGEARAAPVADYEPKMNVTPNAVAQKE